MAKDTNALCSVDRCGRPILKSGLCSLHRGRAQATRRVALHLPCAIPGCVRIRYAREWCNTHYTRWRKWGDPLHVERAYPSRTMTTEEWFWERVNKNGPIPTHRPGLGPCWLWTGPVNQRGYGKLNYLVDGKLITVTAHRFSFMLAFGAVPEDKPFVCHNCDTPLCVRNDTHLFAGTVQDNRDDSVSKDRHIHGDRHYLVRHPEAIKKGTDLPWTKLNDADVLEIRHRYTTERISQEALARDYGINQTGISAIVHRKTWKHLP